MAAGLRGCKGVAEARQCGVADIFADIPLSDTQLWRNRVVGFMFPGGGVRD